ncbi:MAG TPA: hypothetical protein VI381_07090 [Allosphingosinicella sp.]
MMKQFLAVDLVVPGMMTVTGIAMMLLPSRFRGQAQRRHDERLADRLARGEDAYFEELRSLQAYRPDNKILIWRGFGGILLAIGAHEIFNLLTN